ncbi:hypothetical protein B5F29_02805 [Lachnoclostridium sp. An196]|uniref:hypothetical protein n=1 Tax=Lachnoclostridium sp. An196 TaxID=1965583 RepID=UPI000B3ADFAF|nr:hypothetical protein [Lachnoclostridium sp. An196]OUP21429.1 hypothetical protein B5F29_02805 [Lachnoclostridium sp. An196]
MNEKDGMLRDEVYAKTDDEEVEEDRQVFEVELEDGTTAKAELLCLAEIDEVEYAVYALDNEDGTFDILASYVRKDEEGYDMLADIENAEDKRKIAEFVKSCIPELKKGVSAITKD